MAYYQYVEMILVRLQLSNFLMGCHEATNWNALGTAYRCGIKRRRSVTTGFHKLGVAETKLATAKKLSRPLTTQECRRGCSTALGSRVSSHRAVAVRVQKASRENAAHWPAPAMLLELDLDLDDQRSFDQDVFESSDVEYSPRAISQMSARHSPCTNFQRRHV